MPYIECHIATGLTKARKTQLIRDIVQVTHESIGSDRIRRSSMFSCLSIRPTT